MRGEVVGTYRPEKLLTGHLKDTARAAHENLERSRFGRTSVVWPLQIDFKIGKAMTGYCISERLCVIAFTNE